MFLLVPLVPPGPSGVCRPAHRAARGYCAATTGLATRSLREGGGRPSRTSPVASRDTSSDEIVFRTPATRTSTWRGTTQRSGQGVSWHDGRRAALLKVRDEHRLRGWPDSGSAWYPRLRGTPVRDPSAPE